MIDDPTANWNDLRALCLGLAAIGAPVDAYLARQGLPALAALTPEHVARVDTVSLRDGLWGHAAADSRDPWLPVTVGLATPFGAFEIVDYAATAAASVGHSLKQLSRYLRLISPNLQLAVDETGAVPRATLRCSDGGPVPGASAGAPGGPTGGVPWRQDLPSLYTLGVCFSRYAERTVGGFEVTSLALALPKAPVPCPLERYSREAARYGQPDFAFTVAQDVWARPLDGSSPGLGAVLHRHAEELITRRGLTETPTDRFRAAIRRRLVEGDAGVEPVARALGLSARTLHRRLKELGWTFQALLDAERKEVALAHLREPRLSVGEVAYLLGYAEPSAFLRAFRRWTGTTPTQYRAIAKAG